MQKILSVVLAFILAFFSPLLFANASITGGSAVSTGSKTVITTPLNLTTNADGTSWVTYASTLCSQLTITNGTGVALIYRINSGTSIQIANGATAIITGITNANQVGVKRNDTTPASAVVVTANALTLSNWADLQNKANAVYVYSLTRVIPTYAGPAIRVRRSSDAAETDIGFDAAGQLDQAALKAFCGSCFVKTWYDETGTRDVTQATTANQPRIVNAGVIEKVDGKPAVYFNGSNYLLTNAGTEVPTAANPISVAGRVKYDNTTTTQSAWVSWGTTSSNIFLVMKLNQQLLWTSTGTGNDFQPIFTENNGRTQYGIITHDGTNHTAYADGFFIKTGTNMVLNTGAGLFRIGNGPATDRAMKGWIQEVILWNTALTNDQVLLHTPTEEARFGFYPQFNLIIDGDSITRAGLGTGSSLDPFYSPSYLNGWRYRLFRDLDAAGIQFRQLSVAVDGQSFTTQNTAQAAAGGLDRIKFPYAPKNYFFSFLNRNDIGNESDSPATAYSDAQTYFTNRVAAHRYDRIVASTGYFSRNPTSSAPYSDLADLMRNGMGPTGLLRAAGVTDLVDLQKDPVFQSLYIGDGYASDGVTLFPVEPVYTGDHIHAANLGHALIEVQEKQQLPWLRLK